MVANHIFATILHLLMRNTATKAIAFLLLFLFIEKAGLRLWIHTHYHISAAAKPLSEKDTTKHQSVSEIGCDCLDDFFIPLSFTDNVHIAILSSAYFEVRYHFYKSKVSSFTTFSARLRGPPSC